MSQQINLFNPILLKQQKMFSAVTMAQALAVIAVGMLALGVYFSHRLKVTEQDLAITAEQRSSLEAKLAALNDPAKKSARDHELEERLKRESERANAMQEALAVLKRGDIGNTKGYSEYFVALARQVVEGLWLTKVEIIGAGNAINLGGNTVRGELLPVFVGRLANEPVMQGKTFSMLEMMVPTLPEEKDAATRAPQQPNTEQKPEFSPDMALGGAAPALDAARAAMPNAGAKKDNAKSRQAAYIAFTLRSEPGQSADAKAEGAAK